jgi:hypothetical protein
VKRFTHLAAAAAAVAALAACDSPVAPDTASPITLDALRPPMTPTASTAPSPALAALLEGAFAFLPPLPPGEATGEFDPAVLPVLAVQVCDVPSCDGLWTLSHTSSAGPGGQTIRLEEDDELFLLNWRPSDLGLPSPATYRIRVLAAGLVLGGVDVELVSGGARNAATGEALALQENRTLPVKFSVRRNPVLVALVAADGGATAADVADLLVTEFGADAGETVLILMALGYPVIEVGDVLADVFGFTAAQAVSMLQDLGATADDIGVVLAAAFDQTLEEIGSLLAAHGFDAAAVFDALYRVGVDILNDPVDFALGTAMAAMRGLGYAFDDFSAALMGGIRDWTKENITDALGLSGYSLGELVPFMLDVLELTVATLMDKVAGWGAELSDVVSALMDAGAAIEDIVAGAVAAFEATAEAIGQALADAGATALEIAESLVAVFDQTLDEVAATLRALGFDGEAVFHAVYDVATRILDQPVDFALNLAVAVMRGAGYTLDSFRDALVGGIREWTQENLIDALGLSGFSMAELTAFMIDAIGLTATRIVEIAADWGVSPQDLADALAAAGQAVSDFADALMDVYGLTEETVVRVLQRAGYVAEVVGDWVLGKLAGAGDAALGIAARLLSRAGYTFEHVAGWAWEKAGRVPVAFARALHTAGYTAQQVTSFLVRTAGRSARVAFEALRTVGYEAMDVARAVYEEAGASIVDIGAWLVEFYGMAVDDTLVILQELGATLGDLITLLFDFFGLTMQQTIDLLLNAGYSMEAILEAWS